MKEKIFNLRIELREEAYHFLEEVLEKLGSHIDLENISEFDLERLISWIKVLDDEEVVCGKDKLLEKLVKVFEKREE